MSNMGFITNLLSPYGPQVPIEQLIADVNTIFHNFDGDNYDRQHPEINTQIPSIWAEMVAYAHSKSPTGKWQILDFGCGTGFEATQVIRNFPKDSITAITCYDPSVEMLKHCQMKISPMFPDAVFCSSLEEIESTGTTYNLLITNSVLHHLPSVPKMLDSLYPILANDAIWLAGHEPSSRFYKNQECARQFEAFSQEYKWRRFISLDKYVTRLQYTIGVKKHPLQQTAQEAFRRGFFAHVPSTHAIERIVDFQVAHSIEEVNAGRGFDFEDLQQQFIESWKLEWVKTYSFMGNFYEGRLPPKWKNLSHELEGKFPHDGANFCAIWEHKRST